MSLTRDELAKLCQRPKSKAKGETWDFYVSGIVDNQDLFAQYGIDTQLEWCHLIAQWAHETGGFSILWESGAYSASRIMQIFGIGVHSAKVTPEEARRIGALRGEARGMALFDRVYGIGNPRKAQELGNREEGDGYKYRGCGIVQITGRAAHEKYYAGDYSARNIIKAALREWTDKDCSLYANKDDCRRVTKLINGGYNGLADRERYLAKAKRIWPSAPKFGGLATPQKPEPKIEPQKPLQEPKSKPSVKDLVAVSRKAWLLDLIRKWAIRLGWPTGGVGAMQLLDPDGPVAPVGDFLKVNGLWLILACLLTAGLTATVLLLWQREDVAHGRSIPSGEA